jgi:hypothetical protein
MEAPSPDAEAMPAEASPEAVQLPKLRAEEVDAAEAAASWAVAMEQRFAAASAALGYDLAALEAPVYEAPVLAGEAAHDRLIEEPSVASSDGAEMVARLPEPRPQDSPQEVPAALALITPPPPPRLPDPIDTACLDELRTLGVVFTEEQPIDPHGVCHVDHPLKVSGIGSGVTVAPEAIMNCDTARSLALWAKNVLLPAANEHLDATPVSIAQASTYVCRPRNNVAGAKLSEHAHANAVDIASIAFSDGERFDIMLRGGNDADSAFQKAIRSGSCDYFTTVLGPGSDASHATHFHFDMAERRGGYRLCDMGTATAARASDENTKRE